MAEGCLLDPQRLVLLSLLLTDGGYDAQFDQTPGNLSLTKQMKLKCQERKLAERGCIDLGIPINSTIRVYYGLPTQNQLAISGLALTLYILLNVPLIFQCGIYISLNINGAGSTSGIQHNRNLEPNENGSSQGSMVGRCMVSRSTPKNATLVWIAVHNNSLCTGDRMLKWNSHAVTKCWLCNDPMETRDHLFFTCSYSEEVWRKVIRNILGSGYSNEWNQLLLVLVARLQDKTLTFILRYCFQATVYTLWHERNRRRVGELSKAPPVLAALLDKLVRDLITSIKGR
ncbi:hypothetical protein YC2023_106676 [Brassica napus]